MMLLYFLISFPLFLVALVVHEYAHGWVADKLGDPTAKSSGRLTFNPLAHIDPIGTIILPIFLLLMNARPFGWAKPVPVNFYFLRNPKKDMFWVGLAGPFANILTAVFLALLIKIRFLADIVVIKELIYLLVNINIILCVFNLFPVPPLDGSRILFSILPGRLASAYMKIEPAGMFLLLILLWMGIIDKFLWPLVKFLTGIIL